MFIRSNISQSLLNSTEVQIVISAVLCSVYKSLVSGSSICQERLRGTSSLVILCSARIDPSTRADSGDFLITAGFYETQLLHVSWGMSSYWELHACDSCKCFKQNVIHACCSIFLWDWFFGIACNSHYYVWQWRNFALLGMIFCAWPPTSWTDAKTLVVMNNI